MTRLVAGHLPDHEEPNYAIDRHPDGLAWLKACIDCAHRTSDPQGIGDAYQRRMMKFDGASVFYCVHRTDGGFERICACFAAMHRLAQISPSAIFNHDRGAE